MAEMVEFKAEPKSATGSSAARRLRKDNQIPAVIYGGGKAPEMVTLNRKLLWKQVESGYFHSTVYMLDIGGRKERVIPREVQLDPVRDFLLHVDFLRVSKSSRIDVEVPVHFIDEDKSPGLKRGGALNVVRHEIELNCPADGIPEAIEISVAGLDIGDGVHISAVTLPANVTSTIADRDFTIVTITSSAGMQAEREEAEEAERAEAGEAEEGEGEGEREEGSED
jgi:large subunit ribosomal protein L25